ncbi:nucleotide exchange factor GrpE [Borrelia sp. BU AG58]|uniref:nucleotide exchange factor GrpE n=1 Tax=Borrelia sp. BU AG58 TaxID=2887345 RepID=UPI001E456761|nr:nucleotide exchange factor GrpE [Borrelia sp. BU AG58]UER67685.1 nucleotide exchange factor GrpE [Borrelia sp. BU AG58]
MEEKKKDEESEKTKEQENSMLPGKDSFSMEKKIAELESEISNMKDLYLRKQAEFENFRKRLEKDKDNFIKFANENIMKDIVNFLDNLERAIDSSQKSKDFDTLLSGISMIENEILSSFDKKYNLKKFGNLGDIFDPSQHEALGIEEKEDLKVPEIVEVYQKGYCYNNRILRTAKVKVAQSKN